MAGFVGRFEHSVDEKGRIILPVRFRDAFTSGTRRAGFLSVNHEGCIAMWTPGEFERQMSEMLEASKNDRESRNRARVWAQDSSEVDISAQGRIAIPTRLRSFGRLEGEILILGAIDRIELWNPTVWEERVRPAEQWFLEDDE